MKIGKILATENRYGLNKASLSPNYKDEIAKDKWDVRILGIPYNNVRADYYISFERILLPLKDNAQLLTGLPVRELLHIMTVSKKRKRMPPMDVGLREQAHGMHPQLNMVIVSKYALVEKSPGVFC